MSEAPTPPPLDPRVWQRLGPILDRAFELSAAERAAWLDQSCADDPATRALAVALLRADVEAVGFLESPADGLAQELFAASEGTMAPPGDAAPATIGPFRLLREIGQGGMGRVYLAERCDGQFEQRVAVKIVRPGRAGNEVRERFLRERRILAQLQHPGIARLVDGGMLDDGRPYFAMEYVEGVPITEFARSAGLPVDQRIDLMRDVCAAVAYAQQRLIVHRDLKPSNILITPERQVKLLDFGIAKLVGATEEEGLTLGATPPLTPGYAAPEQVRGEAVTTATDVHALGAVLRDLLASGSRPDPGPSGRARGAGPLAGDLANIVARAMADEPERRYPTAAALGEDLRRHRAGLPVEARSPSLAYRARKFARRHAVAVGAGVVIAASLVAGLVATSWQARRAERQALRAEAATGFLTGLFEGADPDRAAGEDPRASELLERGSRRLEQEGAGDPELEAELWTLLGRLHEKRGDYERAARLFARALESNRARLGDAAPQAVSSLLDLGGAWFWQSRYAEADSVFARALELERRRARPDEARLASAVSNLAATRNSLGRYDEAEPLYREAIALAGRVHGARSLEVAVDLNNYATYSRGLGRYGIADSLYHEALDIRREHLPAVHSEIASTLHNLGVTHHEAGQRDSAEAFLSRAVAMRRTLHPGGHARTAASMRMLGSAIQAGGRLAEADSLYRASLEMSRTALGDDHVDVANVLNDLAVIRFLVGDLEGAHDRFAEVLAIFEQHYPADHPSILTVKGSLGRLALETGEVDEAGRVYGEMLAGYRASLGETHPRVAESWIGIGMVRGASGRWAAARDAFESAVATYVAVRGEDHADVAMARGYLARALGELGETRTARRMLEVTLNTLAVELPATHPRVIDAHLRLGHVLLLAGQASAALPHLETAWQARRKAYGEGDPRAAEARAALGRAQAAAGRTAQARVTLEAAIRTLHERRGTADLEARRAVAARALL